MRLEKYLNEEDNDKIVDKIKKDCSFYLNLLDKNNIEIPFFRGNDAISGYDILYKKTHKNRRPQGTNPRSFDLINKWLDKHGHIRRDQCIIATSNDMAADNFGETSYLFPIGKFDYTWCSARDFNFVGSYDISVSDFKNFTDEWYDIIGPLSHTFYVSGQSDDNVVKTIDKYAPHIFTTNKGIDTAYDKKYEIWFGCDSYYLVSKKTFDMIYSKLGF